MPQFSAHLSGHVMLQKFRLTPSSLYTLGALLTGVFFVAHITLFQSVALISPDSGGYISFAPTRPIGYPIFLWFIRTFNPSYSLVPYIQLILYDAAALYMALSFYRLTQAAWLTLGLLTGVLVNIGFIQLSFSLLTDTLWGALLLNMLGVGLRFAARPSLTYINTLWALAGLACLIRPASYAFIPALAVLPLFKWEIFRHRLLKTIGVPSGIFLTILMIGMAGQGFKNGMFRTESFLGYTLIGKVGLIMEPAIPSSSPELLAALVPQSQRFQRITAEAPALHSRYLLSAPYYDRVRDQAAEEMPALSFPQKDPLFRRLAVDIIRAHPLAYLEEVGLQYIALWQCWDLCTFKEQKEYKDLIHRLAPFDPHVDTSYRLRDRANDRYGFPIIVRLVRGTLAAAFLISMVFPLLGLVSLVRRTPISPLLLTGIFTSGVIQSGYSIIAGLQVGIARYSLSFWPCVVLLLAIVLEYIMKDRRAP